MTRANRQAGYTVIELTLSMVFITALLLGIALTVVQIVTAYNKGITTTEVNQAGRSLSDEISRAISQSGKFDADAHFRSIDTGGRICTGQNTYIWNYAKAIEDSDVNRTIYQGGVTDPIYFIKIADTGQLYCQMNALETQFTLKEVPQADAFELLKPGERSLNIFQFDLALVDGGNDGLSRQKLYQVSFTIGAGATTALNEDQTACLAPGETNPTDPTSRADPPYCTIQQFQLVIRSGNGVSTL